MKAAADLVRDSQPTALLAVVRHLRSPTSRPLPLSFPTVAQQLPPRHSVTTVCAFIRVMRFDQRRCPGVSRERCTAIQAGNTVL